MVLVPVLPGNSTPVIQNVHPFLYLLLCINGIIGLWTRSSIFCPSQFSLGSPTHHHNSPTFTDPLNLTILPLTTLAPEDYFSPNQITPALCRLAIFIYVF